MPEGLLKQPVVVSERASAITAIASSPWAPLIAVAGQKQIVLYHAESGKTLGVIPFVEGTPFVLRFSRSGELLLAGGGRGGASGQVIVFNVRTGKRVITVGDELDAVLAADIRSDHKIIS
jgi:hypothetical protein